MISTIGNVFFSIQFRLLKITLLFFPGVSTLAGFHSRAIYDVDWCHKSGLLATAGGDDAIKIFAEDTSECTDSKNAPNFVCLVNQNAAHDQDVNCVAWNPVSQGILASCGDDGEVKLWQIK